LLLFEHEIKYKDKKKYNIFFILNILNQVNFFFEIICFNFEIINLLSSENNVFVSYFSISYTKKISSSNEELWNLISSPEHLNLVHPFCKSNESIVWDRQNSKDILIYLNGMVYFRDFIEWNEGVGYTLMIGRKRGKKSKVIWKIFNKGNSLFLKITVFPYLLNNWPIVLKILPYFLIISPILKNYLSSVVGGINWYLINKKPVKKNHFGKHIWFSKY